MSFLKLFVVYAYLQYSGMVSDYAYIPPSLSTDKNLLSTVPEGGDTYDHWGLVCYHGNRNDGAHFIYWNGSSWSNREKMQLSLTKSGDWFWYEVRTIQNGAPNPSYYNPDFSYPRGGGSGQPSHRRLSIRSLERSNHNKNKKDKSSLPPLIGAAESLPVLTELALDLSSHRPVNTTGQCTKPNGRMKMNIRQAPS